MDSNETKSQVISIANEWERLSQRKTPFIFGRRQLSDELFQLSRVTKPLLSSGSLDSEIRDLIGRIGVQAALRAFRIIRRPLSL